MRFKPSPQHKNARCNSKRCCRSRRGLCAVMFCKEMFYILTINVNIVGCDIVLYFYKTLLLVDLGERYISEISVLFLTTQYESMLISKVS